MVTVLRRIIVTLIVTILLLNICYLLIDFENYIHFLEGIFSKDGRISNPSMASLKLTAYLIILLFMSIVIFNPTLVNRIKRMRFLHLHYSTIFFTVMLCVQFVCWKYGNYSTFYSENGLFETLTVVFLLLAFIILIKCIHRSKSFSIRILLGFMSFGVLIFAMEEISWGQAIFKWKTPQELSRINYQNETNFHNLLNPYFSVLYTFACFLVGLILVSGRNCAIKLNKLGFDRRLRHLFPRFDCIFWGICFLLMSCTSFFFSFNEVIEGMFAVLGLSYSICLYGRIGSL